MPLSRLDESNISLQSGLFLLFCIILMFIDYKYLDYIDNKEFLFYVIVFFSLILVATFVIDFINIIRGVLNK